MGTVGLADIPILRASQHRETGGVYIGVVDTLCNNLQSIVGGAFGACFSVLFAAAFCSFCIKFPSFPLFFVYGIPSAASLQRQILGSAIATLAVKADLCPAVCKAVDGHGVAASHGE